MPAEPILAEQLENVGGTPGTANGEIASLPGKNVTVSGLGTREYVSGSQLQWYVNMPRALPFAADDVTRDFGSDLYSRMLLDAQVRAVVNVLKASVLEDGVTLSPAIDDKEEDGYQQSADLHDQAERMLDDLTPTLDDTLWDLLDAVAVGNRMAEQIYALDTTHTGKAQYTLQTLATKPMESVAFVVDAYLNVLGILGRIPGQPFGVQQGMLLADIEHTANLLPRSKFAVLSFRPVNSDPRGTSVLRPAFDPWNQKQQLKREFLKYLTQFATPSLLAFTAPGAVETPLFNSDGSPALDANGNQIYQTPEELMILALQKFANGTAIALPNGSTVTPVEMSGDGAPFLNAFEFLDRQIVKAVLSQTLATEEGQHQTRAASGTHKDILDTLIRQAKRPVERMIQRDILRTWLRLNGNDKFLDLLPVVTLGTAESEDKAPLQMAVAALEKSGYLHSSQYAEIDKQVGLPERTPPDASNAPVTEQVQVKAGGVIEPITGTETPPPTPATPETTPTPTSPSQQRNAAGE